jgi:HD-GYP domain-containing protein (c-di-GMP phosphodiesterase class II)
VAELQVPQSHLLGVLSLASDHLMGQHPEWGLRSSLLALAVADRAGVREREDVRSVTLLRFVGCTSDAPALAGAFSDDIAFRKVAATLDFGRPQEALPFLVRSAGAGQAGLARVVAVLRVLAAGSAFPESNFRMSCEVADQLTGRLGLPASARTALGDAFERWDGKGFPNRRKGEQSALPARLALLATDATGLVHDLGRDAAKEALVRRSAGAHDPALSAVLQEGWDDLLDEAEDGSAWDRVTAEPGPVYRGDALDEALTVVADFTDLKSVHLTGHSRGVAALAEGAGAELGLDARELRRAGLVHDLGRSTVSSAVWDCPGPLSDVQREEVRLHAYRTERLLARSEPLAALGRLAGCHHERVDGSGYHRGADGAQLPVEARVLGAADVYQALRSARPHRPAFEPAQAAAELRRTPGLDGDAVDAVLTAAGHRPPPRRRELPGGLSPREVEVLELLARGLTNKQIAATLFISAKTVGHHVQHVYDKIGLSTRGGATLWAVQNGVL